MLLFTFAASFGLYFLNIYKEHTAVITGAKLDKLPLDHVNKLMIVAHPDDETIWGGAHLLDGGYLVVCLTNGDNRVRREEFAGVMEASGNVGLILTYPDKLFGKRNDWRFFKNSISKNLSVILSYKDWDEVVTHNTDGEYGHIHHILTNNLVTNAAGSYIKNHKLYYFGKYYKRGTEVPVINPISDDVMAKKQALLDIYSSQGFIDDYFGHMYRYENFITAE